MANAGYKCLIRRGGPATSTVSEAFTLISGTKFQITSTARRVIDPETSWFLSDSVGTIPWTSIASADFLYGEFSVTGVSGTLRFTGSYLPMTTRSEDFYEVKSHTLIETDDLLDTTVYTSTSRFRKRILGLGDASLSMDMYLNAQDRARLATLRFTQKLCAIEVNSGFSSVFRGYGRLEKIETSAAIDGLVEVKVDWKLSAERDTNTNLIFGYSDRLITST